MAALNGEWSTLNATSRSWVQPLFGGWFVKGCGFASITRHPYPSASKPLEVILDILYQCGIMIS